jgi:ATP-dependent Lon protease
MTSKKENKIKINEDVEQVNLPQEVVVIPIVNSPIFPGMIAPIILSQEKFTPELDEQVGKIGYVALNLVKFKENQEYVGANEEDEDDLGDYEMEAYDEDIHDLTSKDIYRVGVLCKVVKKLKLPDGSVNLLVHGLKRFRISKFIEESPLLVVKTKVFEEVHEADEELDAYTRSVINQVKKLSEINPYFNEEMKLAMLNSPSPGSLADLVAFALSLDVPEAQDFLETLVVKKRFAKLLVYLKREKDVADIQKKITDEVNDKVNKYQREYFLREQLKVIRTELGMDEDEKSKDMSKFKELIESKNLPEEAKKAAMEELERLETIPDSSPEYNLTRTYLTWMTSLPWNEETTESSDIPKAKKMLEKDHYGLEKAKERILEFLAVRQLKPEYDGTILCLAGPPGVGKTSLGASIAESLGRKFYRFSLGGMRDEAEIKGHRRTYVGAMPGKLIQAMKRVEVNNPVIMLDEIDKLGRSYQGDPSSALLEVLDPEQNKTFIDNYLDVPYDLSKVLFIATANYLGEIPEALLDRMELIEVSGYTLEEKVNIANKWVVPKQLKKHGLLAKDFGLTATTMKALIQDYSREPGVRRMEQFIAKLCRTAALQKVTAKKAKKFSPTPKDLEKILGPKRFSSDIAQKPLNPGVVTGLAWTSFGGDILFIETLPLRGKGLKLTGQMGDVMNESANIAYSYAKKMLEDEIDQEKKLKKKKKKKDGEKGAEESLDYLDNHQVHLHLPAGATPKDGPSAGITMALAFYSLAKNKKVRGQVAMTGELSLTGKVLPVGGIKEKVLAAKRAGIKEIILPFENEKDLKEVPDRHRKGMKFYPVKHFDEVLKVALK